MAADLANSNANRDITMAGTSIAIFTFLLFFMYPRYQSGEINGVLFQVTLAVIVTVTFSLVISATYYYGTTLGMNRPPAGTRRFFGKADAAWVVGFGLLLLEPSLILFTVNLPYVVVYDPLSLVLLLVSHLERISETNEKKVIF